MTIYLKGVKMKKKYEYNHAEHWQHFKSGIIIGFIIGILFAVAISKFI